MAFWKKRKAPNPPEAIRPDLSGIAFDTTGWELVDESSEELVKRWVTPQGDTASLNLFLTTPDLPPNARSIALLRANYVYLLGDTGSLVELDVAQVSNVRAIRLITKIPKQPHGLIYLGSWTLPFQNFSFVVKVQGEEEGVTGMRESVLFAQKGLGIAQLNIEEGGRVSMADWNPDDAQFDDQFPDHPLSRVRRVMEHLEKSLCVTPAIQKQSPFPLPEPTR